MARDWLLSSASDIRTYIYLYIYIYMHIRHIFYTRVYRMVNGREKKENFYVRLQRCILDPEPSYGADNITILF